MLRKLQKYKYDSMEMSRRLALRCRAQREGGHIQEQV